MQLQMKINRLDISRKSPCRAPQRKLVKCVVAISQPNTSYQKFAATAAAALLLVSSPAQADRWDGSSSAAGSCAIGEAGTECRKASLARDRLGSYAAASDNAAKISGKATGVPVADLNDEYVTETRTLAELTLKYATLGPDDVESRVPLVKLLKKDGQAWVSKYARGGSARKLSARKFYIAVDAVQGHLASNGYAPFPRNKLPKLISDCEETENLLAERK